MENVLAMVAEMLAPLQNSSKVQPSDRSSGTDPEPIGTGQTRNYGQTRGTGHVLTAIDNVSLQVLEVQAALMKACHSPTNRPKNC
jgi:hypothetical protein